MTGQDTEDLRLSHSQGQIWIGQRLHAESPLYNMAFAMVFEDELRTDVFLQAWRRVVDSSDALRTYVEEREGPGVPRLREVGCCPTELQDFSQHRKPETAFRDWCRQRSSKALPTDGELVDSVLVNLGAGRTGWYLNQHHLISDAYSTVLIYREVAAEYRRLLEDAEQGQSQAPPSYYSTTTALAAATAGREDALAHWAARQEHGGAIPLYGRTGRPEDTASSRLTFSLSERQSRELDRLCSEPGFESLFPEVSRFAVFATLLVSWLHRISNASELGFDAPVTGRPTPEAKHCIGLFIEMFPFRVAVDPNDSFRAVGTRCLEESQRFLRHALPGTSAPSGSGAGNIVLNYLPQPFGDFAGIPVDIEWIHPGHGDSVHALRLQVHDFAGNGTHTLHFDFNEGVLPERLRYRAIEHFESLLGAMLDDPDRAVGAVDILTADERRALTVLNDTSAAPLPSRTVVELFEEQAKQGPHRIAVREGEDELTYSSLLEHVEGLASGLAEAGIQPGGRVVIDSRRSALAVVAILACLRAGAAYVPIDPSYPPERIRRIVRDSGARLLLTGKESAAPADIGTVKRLAIEEGIIRGAKAPLQRPHPGLDDLAFLIYTSGSTGQPKGVLVEHGGLTDYLQWASSRYVRSDRLTFPLFTSLAFDLTVTSLFLPLISGGTLDVYPEPDGPVDSALMDVVAANRVDFIKLTPSHLALLRRVDLRTSRLRRMVVGGEDFKIHLAASISAQFDDRIEVYNEYGPTEAVVGCIEHRFDPADDIDTRVPIGRPADHVELKILNDAGCPVPEGVPGELWVSRFGLARGYHGLEELTAERFREDDSRAGAVFYRTGDMVRQLDPGKLEYLGRRDRQLKLSGFRVEPAEIEAAMLSFPGVRQCAVAARPRAEARPAEDDEIIYCARCGLPSNYPGTTFDENNVCNVCYSYDSIAEHARGYFKTMDELALVFEDSRRAHTPDYDCLMLFSGGKDSTYALCRLVEMGLSVYAFTLDNGFISDGAKENIRRVTEQLGVPLEFGETPAMNAIFRDSLTRFSNVCHGCFKAIYTLSMRRARELEIPIIVTGLSRGQMFETRLTEEMFRDGQRSPEEVDAAVLAARKVYHRVNDEVSRSLDVGIFRDDGIFEEVRFVDFYRYCDAGLDEVLSYLGSRVPWVRPADTGRSTNCLINDTGIYVHKKERGFHNYALPYSWDVRLGQKERAAALDELDDELDIDDIRGKLAEIGYEEDGITATAEAPTLAAFYVSAQPVAEADLSRHLAERLPSQLLPSSFRRVDSIPLTGNGKVDERALPWGDATQPATTPATPPDGPVQEFLVEVWRKQLGIEHLGVEHDFFELGGTSLAAMEVMIRLCREFDIDLPLETLFTQPTVRALAGVAEQRIIDDLGAAEIARDS